MVLEFVTPWKLEDCNDHVIGTWKLRRTAILFSKQRDSDGNDKWIFLIFIEPEAGKSLVFRRRTVEERMEIPNSYIEDGKLVYYFEREDHLEDLISYITLKLEREGPNYLNKIAEHILWAWKEFLDKVRVAILSVRSHL